MARYTPEIFYIASIYPGKLEPIRRSYGPSRESFGKNAQRSTLFELKPVPRGAKPFVLEVMDSFEDQLDVLGQSAMSTSVVGQPKAKPRLQRPVDGQQIVTDLIGCWTGGLFNVPQGAKPGVIQINNSVPTQDELAQMMMQQTLYFKYWFDQGELISRADPTAIRMHTTYTKEMRLAAEWLGLQRSWSDVSMLSMQNPCPHCGTMIMDTATVCFQCGRDVDRGGPPSAPKRHPQPVAA